MERKTLIYQPSQAAATTPYANVSAPGGAFGDASGAMAGVGRDIQSVGESVGRIGQIRQQLQNRKDQDSKALGIDLTRASIERVDAEYAEAVKAQSPDNLAFKAYQVGSSSEWKLKRQAEVFQELAKEQKWAPPQDETQSREFRLGQGLLLDRVRQQSAKEDSDRLFENRTTTRIDFDRAAFEQIAPPREGLAAGAYLDLYDQQLKAGMSESGTDKNRTTRSLQENLAIQLRKNPIPLSATTEQREALRPRLIDAGFSDAFISNYLDRTNPEKMDRADYMLALKRRASEVKSPMTAQEVQDAIRTGSASVKNFGDTDSSEIVGLYLESNIRFGPFAARAMKADDVKAVEDTATAGTDEVVYSFWSNRIGKETTDYLTVDQRRQYFKLVQENASQLKTQIQANPAVFAESRSDGLIQRSNDAINALNSGNLGAMKDALDSYGALAKSTVIDAGFESQIDPDRPIIPPSFTRYLATAARAKELASVFNVVGPGVMRQAASSMPIGPKRAVAGILGSLQANAKIPQPVTQIIDLLETVPENDARIKALRDAVPRDLMDKDNAPTTYEKAIKVAISTVTADGAYTDFSDRIRGINTDMPSGASVSAVFDGIANAQGFDLETRNQNHDSASSLVASIAASYMSNGGYSAGAAIHQAAKDVVNMTSSAGLVTATKRKNGVPFTIYYPVEEKKSLFMPLGDKPGAENNDKLDEALSTTLDSLDGVVQRVVFEQRAGFYSGLSESASRFWSASMFGLPFRTDISSYISLDTWKAVIPGLAAITVDGSSRFDRRLASSDSKFYPDKNGNLVFASSTGAANALTARGKTGRVTTVSDTLVVTQADLAALVDFQYRSDFEESTTSGLVKSIKPLPVSDEVSRINRSQIRMAPYFGLPSSP